MKLEEKQLINSLGSQISKQRQYLQNIVDNFMYYYPKWKADPEVDRNVLHLIYNTYVQADKAKWYLENPQIIQFIKNIDNNTGLFGGDRGNFIVGGQSLNQAKFTNGNKKVFESLEETLSYMNEGFFKKNKPSRKNPIICSQQDADYFFGKMQWYSIYNKRFKDAFEILKKQSNNKFYRKINDSLGKIMTTIGKALAIGTGIVSAVGVLGVAIAGAGIVVPAAILAVGGGVATTLRHSGKIGQSYRHGKVTKKWGRFVKELILTSLGVVKIAIGAGIIQRPDILGKIISLFKKGDTEAATNLVVESVQENNVEVAPEVKEQIEEKISEIESIKEQIEEVQPEPEEAQVFFEEVEINAETGETNIDEVIESIPETTEEVPDVDIPTDTPLEVPTSTNESPIVEPTIEPQEEVPSITEEPEVVEEEIEQALNNTEETPDVEQVVSKTTSYGDGGSTKSETFTNGNNTYTIEYGTLQPSIIAENYRSHSIFGDSLESNFNDVTTWRFSELGLTDDDIKQGMIERTEKYNELIDLYNKYNNSWRGKSDKIARQLEALKQQWDNSYSCDDTTFELTTYAPRETLYNKSDALNYIFAKYIQKVDSAANFGAEPPDLNTFFQTDVFN